MQSIYPLYPGSLFRNTAQLLRDYIRNYNIDSVLLGLSGGADSVLTYHLLRYVAEVIPGFRLGVAHVNFNLRGDESRRDENFVRQLSDRFPGACVQEYLSCDTYSLCEKRGISVEMGARILRHEWFDSLREKYSFSRIATGHNADDNEETLLLNLMRGSGTRGLRGMEYDNGRVIRPILSLSRTEILNIMKEIAEFTGFAPGFITDSTNLTTDYRRNFLRHRVIPLMNERWEGIHTALRNTLRFMSEENKIVESAVNKALEDRIIQSSSEILPWTTLSSFPSPSTLIRRWLDPYGITLPTVEEINNVISKESGQRRIGAYWILKPDTGDELELRVDSRGLLLTDLKAQENDSLLLGAQPPRVRCTPLEILTEDDKSERGISLKELTAFNKEKIYLPDPIEYYTWRHPLPGERMTVGHKMKKRISDILKESGISPMQRQKVWILADRRDNSPIWIPGIRRAYSHRIDPATAGLCFRIELY